MKRQLSRDPGSANLKKCMKKRHHPEIKKLHVSLKMKLLKNMTSRKRKPAWTREILREAERYGAPEGSIRERKKPNTFSNYAALMCDLVEQEPTNYEEAVQKKEWVEAMTEEYQSIMKNDVWDIVPKP